MKNTLVLTCDKLIGYYSKGSNWLDEYLTDDTKIAAIIELNRLQKELERLRAAALARPTIAIFGPSQVGKSYLTSNLVKSPGITDLLISDPITGESVSFIKEMNPYGGKESTGTITRFTAAPSEGTNKGYRVKLLSAKDLICIIVNGYYLDVKKHNLVFSLEDLNKLFNDLNKVASKQPLNILSREDIYEIKRYLVKNLSLGNNLIIGKLTEYDFWGTAADLAPYLSVQGITLLANNLWGKQPFLSDLFERLLLGLQLTEFGETVHVDKQALTPNDATILDVERVRELYVEVQKEFSAVGVIMASGKRVSIDRRILAALTAEVEIPLLENTTAHQNREFLKYADVLDFPGARSREHIPEDVFVANTEEAKLQLFIRGKVAYLFDLYNQDYGISTLLYCMHEDNPEVQNIPGLLYDWIANVIGTDKNERNLRISNIKKLLEGVSDVHDISPLLVVLTKADVELSGKSSEISGRPESHDGKWVARIEENFKNFMVRPLSDKWVVDWTVDKPNFNHVFPLRNPDFSTAIFDADESGREIAINNRYTQKLADMEVSFLGHRAVQHHIINPAETWNAFAKPEYTGIDYISKYLAPTCRPEVKLELILGAIIRINEYAQTLLETFYNSEDGDEILRKAKINGAKVFFYLTNLASQNNEFGSLLYKLLLTEDEAWACYNNVQNAPIIQREHISESTVELTQMPVNFTSLLGSLGINIEASAEEILLGLQDKLGVSRDDLETIIQAETGVSVEVVFGKSAKADIQSKHPAMVFTEHLLRFWQTKLHTLQSTFNPQQHATLGILIDELNKAKERLNLRGMIYMAVKDEVSNYNVSSKLDVVARISQQTLNNFINTFGYHFIDEAERPQDNENNPIFSKRPQSRHDVEPNMGLPFPGERIFNHWRLAAKEAIVANALGGANIKNPHAIAANRELGQLLEMIKSTVNAER